MNQLFYKAKIHRALAKTGGLAHLIYTFDSRNLRPYFPLESDYVATCSVDRKLNLNIDGLTFHGQFLEEYRAVGADQLNSLSMAILQALRQIVRYHYKKG